MKTITARMSAASYLLALCVLATPARADITEAEARAKATEVAQKLDWPFGEPSALKLQPPEGVYPRTWKAEFSGFAQVELEAETGDVVLAMNGSATRELTAGPTTVRMTETEARAKAEEILDRLEAPQNGVFRDIRLFEAMPDIYECWVRYDRTFDGIRYRADTVVIYLNPDTGELMGYGRNFNSAPPAAVDIELSKDQALATAGAYAESLGIALTGTAKTKLHVVQPNEYWDPGGPKDYGHGSPSRIAWAVRFEQSDGHYREFWIDAEDGKVLGGLGTR